MDLTTIQQLIADHGYWALFVGTFLEGETFFILAGVAARKGLLNPYYVALIAMAGGFIGDQVFFALGRWRGMEAVTWSRSMARKAVEARRHIRRHAVLLILLSRFLYGLRMVIPLACGMAHVPVWRFVALNFVSALAWCLSFGGVGYLFGALIFEQMDVVRGLQVLLLVLVSVLAVSYLIMRAVKRRLLDDDPPDSREPDQEG
ncbi:MAG: DedA family protein [Desulfarculaceae bacterium]|nr:DedA family protein [Desulfarculaceae bacterium]MCF8073079.1 DedA family protein [Desulfarculaceae bacterium]MCF8101836.1 DedA family protein [Desulfarculaceae bacterium]MCF8115363.1 DedA family protein [Desulfarculaceae bacterium]